jgi:phosphomannomutase
MTLISSISGIRGTIGGAPGDNLTPIEAVSFAAAYGTWLKSNRNKSQYRVVIGRDARPSGPMIHELVMQTLVGQGIHVVNLGLSTTPTVEMAVVMEHADGGIILTASHNPKEWNALKLLDHRGEFLDATAGEAILNHVKANDHQFAGVDELGKITINDAYIDLHIEAVLELDIVDVQAIQKAKFKVVVDGVNSSGGIAVPRLLEALGVQTIPLYCEPNGQFPHNPEPLKAHLRDLSDMVVQQRADFGIAVDPDVDRLAFVCEDGEMFGEEYTLVACADYVLSHTPGATVSNMSSSRALHDVTIKYGQTYSASAVGEVNVVSMMKATNAVIGGEGNGGVILPELHYGRDALAGIALFLSLLAKNPMKVSDLRKSYPDYFMSKQKVELTPDLDTDSLLSQMIERYKHEQVTTIDGVKIDFAHHWVHLRKSNTEPIIRIYVEAPSQDQADAVAQDFITELKSL